MSEARTLPLRDFAKLGRYGADKKAVGVTLSIIHPVAMFTVIARKDQSKNVAAALKSIRNTTVMWAGPDQYHVQSENPIDLKSKLGTSASVIDQSHGRVVIRVSGPKSRAVLAKGTPVDLHPDHFSIGKSAMTQMTHIGVHLTRSGEDEFTLSVFRGFSESFWEWLTVSAAEFGYEVV